jgi:hypothetical protein
LTFPDLSRWPLAKNDEPQKVMEKLRVGHFVLLANFHEGTQIGTVKGVGKIIGNDDDDLEVLWKKPIPSWTLTPNAQGGVYEWKTEGVFCFDAEPARRYKLSGLTSKLFR